MQDPVRSPRCWMFLFGAIGSELVGTISIKVLADLGCPKPLSLAFLYVMIISSYILLSLAVRQVALGVAFAVWEGIGIALVSLFGFLSGETPSVEKVLGLALIVGGIVLLKTGSRPAETPRRTA